MITYEDGIMEFGNGRSCPPWQSPPQVPILPKAAMRRAFEELGALYSMCATRL